MKKVFAILLVLVMVSVLLPSQDVNAYTNSDKCPDCDTGYLNCVGSNDTQHSFQCTNVDCEHHGGNRLIWEKHWGGDATCTDKAKCRACGAEYGELADHSWAWVTDKEPTCGEPGEKHEECSVCHATQNERYLVIPATGKHTFEWVTDKERSEEHTSELQSRE